MNETSAVLRQTWRRAWLLVVAGLFAGSTSVAGVGEVCSANRPCVPGEVCVLPDGSCDQPEAEGTCEISPETCPRSTPSASSGRAGSGLAGTFDPVCGCDAMTYDNRCEALLAGVGVDHPGSCAVPCGGVAGTPCDAGEFCSLPPSMCDTPNLAGFCVEIPATCPSTIDPVCGCDGVTYDNACFADAASAQVDHDGPCVVACGGLTGVTCDAGDFCLLPDGACNEPGTQGACTPTPQECPAVFEPVCGCDGVTYDNRCLADAAAVAVSQEGPCPETCGGVSGTPCGAGEFCKFPADQCDVADLAGVCQPIPESCPIVFDPVCGCDGVTYDNACEADVVGAQIDRPGECPPGCEFQSDCTLEEFCALPDGECGSLGLCEPRPDDCALVFEPVCGCDGVTYANRCLAASASVSLDRTGSCRPPCSGTVGESCPAGEVCIFPDDTCADADLSGACLPVPQSCPTTFEPVCGCDGETYGNRCLAWEAGARVVFDGACSAACGGVEGLPCGADEFCSYPTGTCDVADAFGVCEPLPGQCPEVCITVCGCDGVTYPNQCLASAAGVSLDSVGECDPSGRLISGVRFDTTGDMRWRAAGDASSYNVYREVRVAPPSSYDGECFAAGLPLPEANVTGAPATSEVWLFQVTGVFPEGEGPLGIATDCSSRTPAAFCAGQ